MDTTPQSLLRERAYRDPLVVLAKLIGLVPSDSFDVAWDKLEAMKPGFYCPPVEEEEYIRANWGQLQAPRLIPPPAGPPMVHWPDADRATKLFLYKLSRGFSTESACRVASLDHAAMLARRQTDRDLSRAWIEAEKMAAARKSSR